MKKYKVGMYGGKFMPFHIGHLHCIEEASKQCETLYVLIFHGGDQELQILSERPNDDWLKIESREEHVKNACKKFDNVIVKVIDITNCKLPDGTEDWDAETPLVLNVCGKLDAVFGSEPGYTEYFNRAYPWADVVLIDVDRKKYPISGTKIREMKSEEERLKWII